ncbi:MAG: hypothetical protein IJ802_00235 [Kiritimatiellae bacterium]|nr:hypothetical protein [Kiritimatiellia bacterium]
MRKAYLLAGATASGKTAIAAALAREMGAAVISADSMLVYKGMDIGTAKPTRAEREGYPLGCIDLVTPAEPFSAGDWLRAAQAFAATLPPSQPIIVAGGTGLYFSALLRGLDGEWRNPPPEYPVLLCSDRDARRSRIMARLDKMFADGLEEEVRRLKVQYPVWSVTAAAAIGYKEWDLWGWNAPVVKEKIYFRTCQYAKRQETWFRHQSTPVYVEASVSALRALWSASGPVLVDL